MIIKIIKIDAGYEATINNGNESPVFKTTDPLKKEDLNEALSNLGFHQRDILDAFDEADGASVNTEHPLFEARKDNYE